jgi:RHS repeat-associated protein
VGSSPTTGTNAGLSPSVRLGYNSFSGNGLTGVGWSLEFMSVKRQTDKGFPEYDAGDTFVLGGEELVPLNNGDWRCENERGFQRLRRIDSDGDGAPDAWEVTDRNGTRHTLGRFRGQNNRWSAVEHPEKMAAAAFERTYAWFLDSTTDLHGNRIEYEYIRGIGVLYPSRISYSHLVGNFHEVTFQYEDRPDAFDDYRPTFSARLDRRLRRIEVRSQGELVRAYNFAYVYEPGDLTPAEEALQSTYLDLGVTLLKRVVQVDRSGNDANYLPPLVFSYSGLDLTRTEQRAFSAPPELDLADPNGRVQLADLDGDALPDLFATTAEGAGTVQRVALNRGESRISGQPMLTFAPARLVLGSSPVDLAEPNTVVHDPKGKGLVDMSSLVDDGGNKRLETFGNRARLDLVDEDRLGFSQDNLDSTILANPPDFVTYSQAGTRQMDVNFDKRGDFVNLQPGFGGMTVNTFYIRRDGTWVAGESTLPPSYPLANTFELPSGEPNPCVQLADMNGDRMLDLVCLAPSPSGAGQRIQVSYWPLCGLGRYADERLMPTTAPDTFEIANADLRDVFVDDFTGDGLADILVLDGSGPETVMTLRVNIAGQRWSPPYTRTGLPRYAPRDAADPTVLRLADLNANGSLDLLFRNTAPQSTWDYIELLPQGAPSLMIGIDNGLGRRTSIVYGSAAEDEQLAREAGHPWRTFAPIPLQVVRQIRMTCGLDLNGDGEEDSMVIGFRYRDPYYDGFEREFRGFAYAQRIDYGDDFLFDSVSGLMEIRPGWDTARTPTGQVSGPSLVTRYRFHTGAADQQDNDDYGGESPPPDRKIDEFYEVAGREEEPLKGLERVVEQVDPVVLHSAPDGNFDAGCEAATAATTPEAQSQLTPDAYVYTRARQEWTIRRLYRPTEALPYYADQDADGQLEDYRNSPAPPVPAGRFGDDGISVLAGNGRSVSFVFAETQTTEVHEANGLLSVAQGYSQAPPARTSSVFDYDDYGNQNLIKELGLEDPSVDDERVVTATYALGGNALSLWVVSLPDTISVTDENGVFVSRKVHYYDGQPFVGVAGQIESRALLHRTVEHIDPTNTIQTMRSRFDIHGNAEEARDPRGNICRIAFDPTFKTYPVSETRVVGNGAPDLTVTAEYDLGFGVVTGSTDYNGNETKYLYDSFARLVGIVRPGDSPAFPTVVFEYEPCDPVRGRAFAYDAIGQLAVSAVPVGSVSRVITRDREVSEQPGQYVTATYFDGYERSLAMIQEGEVAGTWVVSQASSFNLRGQPQSRWLPYQILSVDVPHFGALWPVGRPPELDGTNIVVAIDLLYDATGREVRSVNPPETWGGERRHKSTQHLPFQAWIFDEEDTRPGSPHARTPRIAASDGLGRLIAMIEVVRSDDHGEPAAATNHWLTSYEYDLNNQITRITDSRNNVKSAQFDGLGRKISANDPDQGITTYEYDDASNLIETSDAKGQRISYTYDGLNRILTEDYHDETSSVFSYQRSPDVAYFYDEPAGTVELGDGTNATARNTKGLLSYVIDASGEEHTSYDARNRVEWTVKRIPDVASRLPLAQSFSTLISYATRFEYDALSRVTRMRYPDNDEVTYAYNDRSLLHRISGGPTGNIISSIRYRPSGQQEQIDYGNGVRTTHAYDPRLRQTDLTTVSQPSGNQELIRFHYEFDGVSNVKTIQDQRSPGAVSAADQRRNSQAFVYDDLYRLNRVQYNFPAAPSANGGEISYRYDRIGNLIAQSSDLAHLEQGRPLTDLGTMRYGGTAGSSNRNGRQPGDPPGPHALSGIENSSFSTRSYSYDDNGNMSEIDGLRCVWDFKDRLVEVENDAMRTEYRYDYSDRRIWKRVSPKIPPADSESPRPSTVLYPSRHFEVREYEQPTKYIFAGQTRVARLTGSLSPNSRVQRIRLDPGWNLCSLAVGGIRLPTSPWVDSRLRWDALTRDWQPVSTNDLLTAGSVLWFHAITNTVLAINGNYSDPTNQPVAPGGSFLPAAGLEAANIRSNSLHLSTSAWYYDAYHQSWRIAIPSIAESTQDLPGYLAPGSAVFVLATAETSSEAPDPALRICYYHQDHLGSSSVLTDADGRLLEETAYYPFGSPRHQYVARESDEPYTFTQKERDAESLLYYFETRYLAASLSRFITIDRKFANAEVLSPADLAAYISEPQRLNLYAYCNNNPIRFFDPDGQDDEDGVAIGVAVGAEAGVWGNVAIEAGPTLFTPKLSEAYKIWKYDVGLCVTVGAGVGTPGASVSANMNFNPGGRSSYEGTSRTTAASVGEGGIATGSYSQTSGSPTISGGVGIGVEFAPAVGVAHRKSYTKCLTVGDVVSTITSPIRSVPSLPPPRIDLPTSREQLSISSRSVAYEDPPPPPRPQPKYSPPTPSRQPRPKPECWTRGVPP